MTRLGFEILCEMSLPTGKPLPVALALRGYGWVRLTLEDVPAGIEVNLLSNLNPLFLASAASSRLNIDCADVSLRDVYTWLMTIAFDRGPVSVEIDEEGSCALLYAALAQDGDFRRSPPSSAPGTAP